ENLATCPSSAGYRLRVQGHARQIQVHPPQFSRHAPKTSRRALSSGEHSLHVEGHGGVIEDDKVRAPSRVLLRLGTLTRGLGDNATTARSALLCSPCRLVNI